MMAGPPGIGNRIAAPRWVLSGLAVYMGLHVLARVFIAPAAVELDEAEQLVHAQALQWGYYTDPPLYTWLQMQVFHVMGVSVLALSLLKHALLFTFYAAVYVVALAASGSRRCALGALLTLPLVPVLGWMSHKDLTHTILASTLAAGCLVLVLRAPPRPRTWHYALLGGLLGLGILSKYAFLLFAAGLACAVWRDPRWGRFVRDARCGLTLAVAAVIVAPHAVWLWEHRQVLALISYKLQRPSDVPLTGWSAVTVGLGQVAGSVAGFVTPLVLAYSIAGGWRFFSRESWRRWPAVSRMLTRLAAVVLGLALVGVVAFQVTELKSRWFHTAFFVGAIILPLAIEAVSGRERLGWIIRLGGAAAAVTLLAVPIHHVIGAKIGNPSRPSAPFARLGPEIWNAFPGATRVLAADRVIAGSLRLQYPALAFWVPEYWTPRLGPASGDSLAVWDATGTPTPPRGLRRLVEESTGQDLGRLEPRFFEARYPFQTERSMRLAVVRLPVKGPPGGGRGQEP